MSDRITILECTSRAWRDTIRQVSSPCGFVLYLIMSAVLATAFAIMTAPNEQRTNGETVNCTVNSENALDDESEKN